LIGIGPMPEEFPGSTDPEPELAAIRHRYVDHLWRGAAILAILSVPASLIRTLEFGWQPFMTLQLLLAVLVLSVNCLLQRLPMKIKTALLFFVFWAVGISGILSLGLLAVGIWFMAFATVMAVVLYSLRAGPRLGDSSGGSRVLAGRTPVDLQSRLAHCRRLSGLRSSDALGQVDSAGRLFR